MRAGKIFSGQTMRWVRGLVASLLVLLMTAPAFAQSVATAPVAAAASQAAAASTAVATAPAAAPTPPWYATSYDTGSTAWMLAATALVMIMMPGLALYYGGIVRRKNFLATMITSYSALGVIVVQWFLFGYMLAFAGPTIGTTPLIPWLAPYIGWDPSRLLMWCGPNTLVSPGGAPIPETIFNMFQAMFAVITPALIAGSIAERMKYGAWCLFIFLWGTLVYDPLAHFIWGGGWLSTLGAVDFAGGTVVHISSGVSGLVAAIMIGKRLGYPGQGVIQPNSLFNTLTGAGLLWFGWYGFNAGSANAANPLACTAFLNTTVATAMAGMAWNFAEWMHHRRATTLGIASGFVAGLVAITPACGYVTMWSSLIIGALAGVVCYGGAQLKTIFGYDDALDAFGVHAIGGFLGAMLTGVFASQIINPAGPNGAIYGNWKQLWYQFLAASDAVVVAAVGTAIIIVVLDKTIGLRVPEEVEIEGLDLGLHGEVGYDTGSAASVALPGGMT